ncbi:MAG: DoxX family protein [Bdellovibrionales bacterium]|nr:DoxX family protein [Oligoflexia bacterium]
MIMTLSTVLQVLVAITLLWVWLVQAKKPTPYRGGNARSLKEEFAVYSLPNWSLWVVGGLKIAAAFAFLAGIWLPGLALPAAVVVFFLMVGAVAMHLKVSDPIKKAAPASVLLVFCAVIAIVNF